MSENTSSFSEQEKTLLLTLLKKLFKALSFEGLNTLSSNVIPERKQERFTLLLDESTAKVLDEIQRVAILRSRADVFDLAINLLDWVVDQIKDSYEIGRLNPQTGIFDQLLIPIAFDSLSESKLA